MLTFRNSRCVGEIQRARCFLRSLVAGLESFSAITMDGCFESRRIQALKAAFEIGHLGESERLCSSAISADDKCLDAFVIKAAIRRREDDEGGERLMARLVSPYLDETSFARLVDDYSAGTQVNTAARKGPMVPPWRGMAKAA